MLINEVIQTYHQRGQKFTAETVRILDSFGFVLDHYDDCNTFMDFEHEDYEDVVFMYFPENGKILIYDDGEEIAKIHENDVMGHADDEEGFMRMISIEIGDMPLDDKPSWAELSEKIRGLEIHHDEEDLQNLNTLIENICVKHEIMSELL